MGVEIIPKLFLIAIYLLLQTLANFQVLFFDIYFSI